MLNSEDLEFGITESFGDPSHHPLLGKAATDTAHRLQGVVDVAVVCQRIQAYHCFGPSQDFTSRSRNAHLVMRGGYLEFLTFNSFAQMASTAVALLQVLDHGSAAHDVQELRSPTDAGHRNLVFLSHFEDQDLFGVPGTRIVAAEVFVAVQIRRNVFSTGKADQLDATGISEQNFRIVSDFSAQVGPEFAVHAVVVVNDQNHDMLQVW